MCDTPEYVDRRFGSFVYRVTFVLSNVCDTPEYVDIIIGSFVYRDSVRMSHLFYSHQYEDRSLGSFVYRITVRLSHVCGTPEYEDRRQVLVHLYINSQSRCPMGVTHLNTRIEGKSWFTCHSQVVQYV